MTDFEERRQARIDRLHQAAQTAEASANKLIRKNDREGLAAMGFSEARIASLFEPDFTGRIGFASWELSNNNANIGRLRARIEDLAKRATETSTETTAGDLRIVDNVEANRVQIFFPGKPDDAHRRTLKQYGFRWTPTVGCWQAYRSFGAMAFARQLAGL